MKKVLAILLLVSLGLAGCQHGLVNKPPNTEVNEGGLGEEPPHPLSIEALRQGEYPGSDLAIEQELEDGSNYMRYIASYKSEGLKIYGLLTIPIGQKPEMGWPTIIFNHGYIPPTQYKTTEKYIAYTDAFSRSGYILFRPDYRGHGNSEGEATGAYGSNAYTIDVLNALASVKRLPEADPNRVGMWGHSMGGFITLRSMVVNKEIKAGVIWAGVVGTYDDMLNNWHHPDMPPRVLPTGARRWRQLLTERFGTPQTNPDFWNSLSANSYLGEISGPVQLHHGTGDTSVPVAFSEKLEKQLEDAGKTVELYTYAGDDHNLSGNFSTAMNRSVEFMDRWVKGE